MLTKNFEELKALVEEHVEKDRVAQGFYWEGGRGCFIGCLNHSDMPYFAANRYGLPVKLQRLAEDIFEMLSPDEARAFFAALPAAIGCNGKDLTGVNKEAMADLGWDSGYKWNPEKQRFTKFYGEDNFFGFYRRGRDLLLKLIAEAPVDA